MTDPSDKIADAQDKMQKAAATSHNISQILFLIKQIVGTNGKMPGFIIKMYALWYTDILEHLSSGKTVLPKEEVEALRITHKEISQILNETMEAIFDRYDKISEEKQKSGL